MPRYKCIISYDGHNYMGFQIQNELPTIELELENAILKFIGKEVKIIGGDYILDNNQLVKDMRTCLWYYPSENVVVIKAFHPSVAADWKVLEKVFSPFRVFVKDINPSF